MQMEVGKLLTVQRLSTIIHFAAEIDSMARKQTQTEQPLKLTGLKTQII